MLMIIPMIPRNLAQAIKADTSELPMIAAGFRELNFKQDGESIFPGSGWILHLVFLLIFIVERRRTVIN